LVSAKKRPKNYKRAKKKTGLGQRKIPRNHPKRSKYGGEVFVKIRRGDRKKKKKKNKWAAPGRRRGGI